MSACEEWGKSALGLPELRVAGAARGWLYGAGLWRTCRGQMQKSKDDETAKIELRAAVLHEDMPRAEVSP